MKILVAGDDRTSGILVETILRKAGYKVVRVDNGQAALDHLKESRYDALLTDWMMPHMDGIELIRQARSLGFSDMPIIVVTALVSEDARVHALNSGADGYLPKPFKGADLLSLVGKCLAQQKQALPARSKVTPISLPMPHEVLPEIRTGR